MPLKDLDLDFAHDRTDVPLASVAPAPRAGRVGLDAPVRAKWDSVGAGPQGELYGPGGEIVGRIDSGGRMWTLDRREMIGGKVRGGRLTQIRTVDGEVHGTG